MQFELFFHFFAEELKSFNRKVMPEKPVEVKKKPKKPVEKITKVLQCVNCAYIDYTSQFRTQEVNDLNNKIQCLENEKLLLGEQLQERDAQDSEIVQTKKNGKSYTDDLRNAIFMCFENGVPITKLEKVIRGVAKYLTNKDLSNFQIATHAEASSNPCKPCQRSKPPHPRKSNPPLQRPSPPLQNPSLHLQRPKSALQRTQLPLQRPTLPRQRHRLQLRWRKAQTRVKRIMRLPALHSHACKTVK